MHRFQSRGSSFPSKRSGGWLPFCFSTQHLTEVSQSKHNANRLECELKQKLRGETVQAHLGNSEKSDPCRQLGEMKVGIMFCLENRWP